MCSDDPAYIPVSVTYVPPDMIPLPLTEARAPYRVRGYSYHISSLLSRFFLLYDTPDAVARLGTVGAPVITGRT